MAGVRLTGLAAALGVVFWLLAAFLGFRTAMSGPRRRSARPIPPDQPAPGSYGTAGPQLSFGPPGSDRYGFPRTPSQPDPADGPGLAPPQNSPPDRPER